ncbi:HNH endonuclease [Corynebacterium striatum]
MSRWAGRYSQRMTALVLAEYGDVCHLCGRPGATTADHIVPRSRGGNDSLDNLRPAHVSCNSARQAVPLAEWFARHPRPRDGPRAAPSRRWK